MRHAGVTDAQSAYEQAVANCNITKLGLNDSSLRSAESQLQSAKTTLDVYGHLWPDKNEESRAAVAAALSARKPQAEHATS